MYNELTIGLSVQVKAFGPGLKSGVPVSGHPTSFTVDARNAGAEAPVGVHAKTAEGDDIPIHIKDNNDGTYECSYSPQKPIKHTIIPAYDGVAVKDSPFRVNSVIRFVHKQHFGRMLR